MHERAKRMHTRTRGTSANARTHLTHARAHARTRIQVASQVEPDILAQEVPENNYGPAVLRLRQLLQAGARLRIDPAWPTVLQAVIARSWVEQPHMRPEFHELADVFRQEAAK